MVMIHNQKNLVHCRDTEGFSPVNQAHLQLKYKLTLKLISDCNKVDYLQLNQ